MTGFEIGVLILIFVAVSTLGGILSKLGEVNENVAKLKIYTHEITNILNEGERLGEFRDGVAERQRNQIERSVSEINVEFMTTNATLERIHSEILHK
jgi:hypothetical protein